jgi:hypothetical protein
MTDSFFKSESYANFEELYEEAKKNKEVKFDIGGRKYVLNISGSGGVWGKICNFFGLDSKFIILELEDRDCPSSEKKCGFRKKYGFRDKEDFVAKISQACAEIAKTLNPAANDSEKEILLSKLDPYSARDLLQSALGNGAMRERLNDFGSDFRSSLVDKLNAYTAKNLYDLACKNRKRWNQLDSEGILFKSLSEKFK